MSWHELVTAFLTSKAHLGLTRDTLHNGDYSMRRWMGFCREQGLEPGQVGEAELEGYRQALFWGLELSTQTGLCQWARQLLRWAFQQGFLLVDPGRSWKLPQVPPRELVLPSVGQLQTLLAALADDRPGLRDRAILETLYGTGLRVQECQNLDLWDFQLAQRQIQVRSGKGGRPRLVPVGEQLEQALGAYLERSRPGYRPRAGENALFLNKAGGRLLREGYRRMLLRAASRAGLGAQPMTPHTLRHAFASHLLEHGAPVEAVSALLGHAALRSTQRYLHVLPQALHQEHQRTHPRARKEPM